MDQNTRSSQSDASTIGVSGSSYTLLNYSDVVVGSNRDSNDDGLMDEMSDIQSDEDGNNHDHGHNQRATRGPDSIASNSSQDVDFGTGNGNDDGDEADDDPLQVRELASSFDNLMKKIQERTRDLAQQVELNVSVQKTNYEVEIDKIQDNLERIKFLVYKCDSINTEFQKLEQINYIAKDFSGRLSIVERDMKEHLKRQQMKR